MNSYDYWIFDLDNTIYDYNLGLFRRISQRMTEYIKKAFNLTYDDALNLQKDMYKKYGLTLRGLIIEKNIDPDPFLDYVHDVEFNDLDIDFELKHLLGKINGQKLIYTNASYNHAQNILKSMGIFEEFEIIFDIKDANYIAKPNYESYDIMKNKFGLNSKNIDRSIFFEDTAKNLKPASELGMSTVWIENDFNRKEADIFQQYIDFTGSDIKTILSNMLKNQMS
ncbi:pyrimidine 5'-nucleotidase [Alphaproteobacteria bacterium]|nr:pyrimidine 5'-nucleotidase [Alphaproteobacteria bacterium]